MQNREENDFSMFQENGAGPIFSKGFPSAEALYENSKDIVPLPGRNKKPKEWVLVAEEDEGLETFALPGDDSSFDEVNFTRTANPFHGMRIQLT